MRNQLLELKAQQVKSSVKIKKSWLTHEQRLAKWKAIRGDLNKTQRALEPVNNKK